MGAAASTTKLITVVEIKSRFGVLYDDEAASEFAAHATKDASGQPAVASALVDACGAARRQCLDARRGDAFASSNCSPSRYAKRRGWLQRNHIFYSNLKQFLAARTGLKKLAREHLSGSINKIAWRGVKPPLGDKWRQCGLDGSPAATIDALYAVSERARPLYESAIKKALGRDDFAAAPLKGRGRALEKARNECCTEWSLARRTSRSSRHGTYSGTTRSWRRRRPGSSTSCAAP